jgi:hypothetical protein
VEVWIQKNSGPGGVISSSENSLFSPVVGMSLALGHNKKSAVAMGTGPASLRTDDGEESLDGSDMYVVFQICIALFSVLMLNYSVKKRKRDIDEGSVDSQVDKGKTPFIFPHSEKLKKTTCRLSPTPQNRRRHSQNSHIPKRQNENQNGQCCWSVEQ